jgi:hypothetical protein
MRANAPHHRPADARQIRTAVLSETPKLSCPVYRTRLATRTSEPAA